MAKLPQKYRAKIIQALRKISLSWMPRIRVKNRQKRAPAVFQCSVCGVHCYEGSSKKSYDVLKEAFPDLIREKVHMDHIFPVVAVGCEDDSFDLYIERLFVEEDGWQCLCKACHDVKTKEENKERREIAKAYAKGRR